MNQLIRFLSIISFVLTSFAANADLVRMDYTGVMTFASGIFSDEVGTNCFVNGSFFIDTGFNVQGNNTTSDEDYHWKDTPSLSSVWELNVRYGTEFHTTANRSQEPYIVVGDLPENLNSPDYFYYIADPGPAKAGVILSTKNLISAGSPSLTGRLSFAFLEDVAQNFTNRSLDENFSWGNFFAVNSNDLVIGKLAWSVTSLSAELISVSQIPLPLSFVLLGSSL